MNSSVARIEMLGRCMEWWAAMISVCLATTLASILLSAQNVFHAVLDLGRHGPQARLQLNAPLSKPMMAKLEAIGRHCELLRRNAHRPFDQSRFMARRIARTVETDEPDAWGCGSDWQQ
jgi:hypothetical protein